MRKKMAAALAVMAVSAVFKTAVEEIRSMTIAPSGTEYSRPITSGALSAWLGANVPVKASVITFQTWLSKDWDSSVELVSTQVVESSVGDTLRVPQYARRFKDDASAAGLSEELAESQPPVLVIARPLR